MIPVQKRFPPERLREALRDKKRLESLGWNVSDMERAYRQAQFDRWKLSQRRLSWIYSFIVGAILVLILFIVGNGGCNSVIN